MKTNAAYLYRRQHDVISINEQQSQFDDLAIPIRNLKIICAAMIAIVVFLGGALCVTLDFDSLGVELKMLVLMASCFGAVMFMMSYVAFRMLSGQTRARNDHPESHFKLLRTAWIVRYSILDAACILNLMVTTLHHSIITLFVAVLGILLMVLAFPRTQVVAALLHQRLK